MRSTSGCACKMASGFQTQGWGWKELPVEQKKVAIFWNLEKLRQQNKIHPDLKIQSKPNSGKGHKGLPLEKLGVAAGVEKKGYHHP